MSRYNSNWRIEVRHDGLNRLRVISGADKYIVEEKARLQRAAWDEQWARQSASDRKRQDRAEAVADKTSKIQQAAKRTAEAQREIAVARSTLAETLKVDDQIVWQQLKPTAPFSEPRPAQPHPASHPPTLLPSSFAAQLGFLDKLLRKRREEKEAEAKKAFGDATLAWRASCQAVDARNQAAQAKWQKEVKAWGVRKKKFEDEQAEASAAIDRQAARYLSGDIEAIEEYVDLVLSRSAYPDWYDRKWEVEYQAASRTLAVNYFVPDFGQLPSVAEWKYVATRDEFTSKELSKAEQATLYDEFVYQVCLRTIHEILESDRQAGHIDAVAFNGWVDGVNPATGQARLACICTVQTTAPEFNAINLGAVEPKACFKSLRGVSAARLDRMAPVAPLIALDRSDSRFIEGQDIVSKIDQGSNLAAMDWQDFEHLIRQIFEYEFSSPGSEVKVTQGSRDGGVDAVAFDPDPIRGGKIVIQAKRYTNTVGVEAVRDLYGTVMNEGACKGILVTTSQFGPDARKFASGKPLTLIDGSNLLFLLQKQGVKGHIDLAGAKSAARG